MKERTSRFRLLAFTVVLTFMGCSMQRPPTSPYSGRYDSRIEGVRLPDAEAIQREGALWTFSKPLDEVWAACLQVAHQYEGLLRLNTEDRHQRRLLFVHGQEMLWRASSGHSNSGMSVGKFLDTWIAVAVSAEEGSNRTTVAAAWVSPDTGKVTPLPQMGQRSGVDTAPGKVASRPITESGAGRSFDAITAALAEERTQIAMHINQTETPEERWQFIPQATINEFLYHLTTQLYGPERWRAKFADQPAKQPHPLRELKDLTRDTAYDQHANTEEALGNWTSARLRRSLLVVHSPQVETVLREVVERLRQVAKMNTRQVGVYIVASPEINAFVVPNGDVFLTTGLLEALDTIDEVAAVLGHELDHLFQHDTLGRLESIGRAQKTQAALMMVAMIAGPVAGAAAGLAAQGSQAAATGMSFTSQMISNMATTSVYLTSGALGASIGSAIVTGYGQDTELRADANSARYLWAAGYDTKAMLHLLGKLEGIRAQAEKRNEPIVSGFLNARPGLEKRREEIRAVLEELGDTMTSSQ